jgi:hypothetical protein
VALATAVLAVPAAASAPAAPRAKPARWHFSRPDGLEWSILFRRDAAGDETRLLVKAPGGRFELLSAQDAASRTSEESIRSLDEDETFARRLVLSGLKTEPACAAVKAPDACVLFVGKNGSVATSLSALSGKQAASLRERAAALPSDPMRRRLLALGPFLPTLQELFVYGPDFLALVWPEAFGARKALAPGTRTPGCAFDAAFGFPCSAEERAREAKRFGPSPP